MEWWLALIIIFGGLFLLMASGIPVAFGFALVNIIGMFVFMGGQGAVSSLILSMSNALTVFSLIPVPLFVLMGEGALALGDRHPSH